MLWIDKLRIADRGRYWEKALKHVQRAAVSTGLGMIAHSAPETAKANCMNLVYIKYPHDSNHEQRMKKPEPWYRFAPAAAEYKITMVLRIVKPAEIFKGNRSCFWQSIQRL